VINNKSDILSRTVSELSQLILFNFGHFAFLATLPFVGGLGTTYAVHLGQKFIVSSINGYFVTVDKFSLDSDSEIILKIG